MAPDKPSFLEELKRRHVWRVTVAYAVVGWLLVQIATQVFPFFRVPDWAVRVVIILIVIGFPVAVAFAWIYELTPEGIRRTAPEDSPEARPAPQHRQIGRKLNAIIVAALVLAVALLGWRLFAVRHATTPAKSTPIAAAASAASAAAVGAKAPARKVATSAAASVASTIAAQPIPAKSVAVLPFENLSADKNNAYFADGIQDLILTKLADIGDLKVIARTSTMSYGSHPENLTLVGKQLGVATILEGSVQKAGNKVLINVQLIDAKTDSHIWAESYTRTLTNIFGVEGEVAGKVADALNAELTAAESERVAKIPTRNPIAYDAYLKGEYYCQLGLSKFSKTDYQTGFSYYRKAVAKSPDFALAWAQLASCQLTYLHFYGNDISGLVGQAKAAMDRALALQPQLEEAYVAEGQYLLFAKFDLNGAARAFAKAHALKPQDWRPIFIGGVVKEAQGHYDAAIEAFQQANALNPRAVAAPTEIAFDYMVEGRYVRAERAVQRPLAIDPSSVGSITLLARAYVLDGNLDAAGAVYDAAPANVKSNATFLLHRARYLIVRRDWAAARATFLQAQAADPQPDWKVECGLGDVERLAGRPDKAQPYYQRCAKILPSAPQRFHGSSGAQPGNLGLALIHLGQTRQALAEGRRGLAKYPSSHSALLLMAEIDAQAKLAKNAVATLDHLLSTPDSGAVISTPLLKLDPTWDPIRHDPRFQALLRKYAKDEPAAASFPTPPASAATQ